MKQIILVLAISFAVAFPIKADDAAGIREVIAAQIDAFKARDAQAGFAFASPGIQAQFEDAARFAEMVEQGYPMVWAPEKVIFLDGRAMANEAWQRVLFEDADGKTHLLDYQLIRAGDGWRIDGVVRIKRAGEPV